MTETKKTLQLLNARYQEVALIVGLNVLSVLALKMFQTAESPPISIHSFLFLVFVAVAAIVSNILNYGFQRTAFLEGEKNQMPSTLLKTGATFFWRMLKFGLCLIPLYLLLIWLAFTITKKIMPPHTSLAKIADDFPLIYHLCFALPTLILFKPLALMPAVIIVLNWGVLKSWKSLKCCKILKAKELVVGFCLLISLGFLWIFLRIPDEPVTVTQHLLAVIPPIVTNCVSLGVAIIAIRFVASQNLVYDDSSDSKIMEGQLE